MKLVKSMPMALEIFIGRRSYEQYRKNTMNNNLLTEADSKRVSDALIEKINDADFNIAWEVQYALREFFVPQTDANWKKDWLPLMIEDMCEKIVECVSSVVYNRGSNL